tara:strand:+ start:530 stop:1465 length:936 start_codon:yes stop_codon:yes gene_type:complete
LTEYKNITVNNIEDETRIDKWLKRNFPLLTQSYIENKLRRGLIRINSKKIKSNYRVLEGDVVNISGFSENIFSKKHISKFKKFISSAIFKKFNDSIIYESNDFLVINKWSGISVHDGSKQEISIDNLIKNISHTYSLVHRLDKETTGLLLISKNYKSARNFGKLFKNSEIEKIYLAICHGTPKNLSSIIKIDISKKNSNQKLETITNYVVINKSNKFSLILFKPITGRTHQLRIISKYLNCPIVGDNKYGYKNTRYSKEKFMLNAFNIKFNINNTKYEFSSKIPNFFINFIKKTKLRIPKIEKIKNLSKTF